MGYLSPHVPYFVVGYTGWTTLETLMTNCASSPVDGVLVIDAGLFFCKPFNLQATGDLALWGLIVSLSAVSTGLKAVSTDLGGYA
jgi:hypothetical protein